MTYRISYRRSAKRDLDRLPLKVVEAAIAFIENVLAENPRRVGKPLGRSLEGRWSARRLDYRVIYEINDDTIVIDIVRIAHRADVYRPR